jgi:hypothetical protein
MDAPREVSPPLAGEGINLAWPQEFAYWLVYPGAGTDQPRLLHFANGYWSIRTARKATAEGLTYFG